MSSNPFIQTLNVPVAPHSREAEFRAVAHLYHALFTGLMLHVVLKKGAAVAGEWTYRLFRAQHLEKFASSFDKLGLTEVSDAVAAAQYHYLSNSVGGVEVEFIPETDKKAWVHFCHPRWMFDGTALCGMPVEISRGILTGWYGHNGVSLGNRRLGFVCTSQDMTGQYGLAGYFQEFDRELAPEERVQYSPGELAPKFDPALAPQLDLAAWPAERLIKANRNYAMEYIKTGLTQMLALLGPDETRAIVGNTAGLIGRQFYRGLQETLGLGQADESAHGFAEFMKRFAAGQDDDVETMSDGDGVVIGWTGWRLMRGLTNLHPAAFEAWLGLFTGALAVHNRFLRLDLLDAAGLGEGSLKARLKISPVK